MKVIEVLVSPKGESQIKTLGYAGSSCQQASRWLENTLGQVTAETKTAEFYQSTETQQPLPAQA